MLPEELARQQIDAALCAAGWAVQDANAANLFAARGVAVREFRMRRGHGAADYLLFVDRQALGAIEAKKAGEPLTGVETQAEKYSAGLPDTVPAPLRPLPFLYQSTGVETRFTNGLDPAPRSRRLFSFHRPETLAEWAAAAAGEAAGGGRRGRGRSWGCRRGPHNPLPLLSHTQAVGDLRLSKSVWERRGDRGVLGRRGSGFRERCYGAG